MNLQPPRPRPTGQSAAFWAATADGRLLLQQCEHCGASIFYPRVNCTECGSTDLIDVDAAGRGTVYTYTVARRPTHAAFADAGPYVIAIVELDEGPRLTTNIVGCEPSAVAIGMAVEVVFGDPVDGIALPYFTPVSA